MLNDVPLSSQTLGLTQPLIRNNFSSINTAFEVNHIGYNLTDAGKHSKVTLPLLTAPLPGSWLTNEIGLYNASSTSGNDLYVHLTTFAGAKETPFTNSTLKLSTPTVASRGWTYLPSGMLLITGSANGNGLTTVTLTGSGIPSFSQILMVVVSPFSSSTSDANIAVRLVAIGSSSPSSAPLLTTQFQVYVSSRTSSGASAGGFSYIALVY